MTLLLALALQIVPYQDPSFPAVERAKDLVSRMTVDEKIAQCMMDAPAIPRLGVPKYHYWSEALHGIANDGYATVFPQAIALASTWDPELMHSVATVTSTEARGKYALALSRNDRSIFKGITLWSPNVNLFRDPRWGRGQETYGEDPFLTSRMGVAFVTGIQGDDPKYLRAVSTPKHFAVHSGPEPLRHGFDAKVTEKELREFYLPQFEACVREGHAASVMSAYSGFNGVPDTGNPWLLTTLLRGEWGFNGAVVSDVDSVGDIFSGHHAVADQAEASAMAIKAGNDECSGTTYRALKPALARGLITEADIDRAATRLFTLRFRLGMFDSASLCAYNAITPDVIDTPEHERLALKAAEESLVLLKNDGILPLGAKKYAHVAVMGPVAKDERVLTGNYNGTPKRPVTLLDGIKRKLEAQGTSVEYLEGSRLFNFGNGLGFLPFRSTFTDRFQQTSGLRAEIFDNPNLDGKPVGTRTDRFLNLHWSAAQPMKGLPNEHCSVRWSGVLVWPSDETVSMGVATDGGVRLRLGEKTLIDRWDNRKSGTFRVECSFKKGVPVEVSLEYSHGQGAAAIQLGSSPVQTPYDYSPAEELARRSDLVILTLGITPQLEGEEMPVRYEGFAGGDRTSIMLPKPQMELWRRVAATGKPVVVVLTGGSALSFDPKLANGILLQWYSGEQGGNAVANALVGDSNPSGRLPVTFYRSERDLPPFDDYHLAGRTYRYFRGRPLYPFGYGLSYARFNYGKATLESGSDGYSVKVSVANLSPATGEEVVEVYARYGHPDGTDPVRKLVGFTRVKLGPSETKEVSVPVTNWALRSWNETAHRYEVRPDTYTFEIGPYSGKVASSVRLTLKAGQ
ncbi:MAG: glycoside hydrolase family 3 C-terminal domain-containing protein [Fimbriimonas sp.]|nr:glycoside hydrolase family 3 C-terminal domain-containing protein [Fimbriimonas sp.]